MNKTEILLALQTNHQQFADYIQSLSAEEFLYRKGTKWSAGQHAQHIVKAVSPVAMAFGLPTMVPRLLYGKTNRPGKTYNELVEKYKNKLAQGGVASARFVPKEVGIQEKYLLPKAVMYYTDQLCNRVEKLGDAELDTYILPHPLLGKITFREMLFFTAYHVQHHHGLIQRDLGK